MGLKWTRAVWEAQDVSHTALPVLLALADHADDDGQCWPSLARLAAMTRTTPRYVRKVLAQAEVDGLVYRSHRVNASTVYQLKVEPAEVRSSEPGEVPQDRGERSLRTGGGGPTGHPREVPQDPLTTREPPDESSSSTTTPRARRTKRTTSDPLPQYLDLQDAAAFLAWLETKGSRNPAGLVRTLHRDGDLTERIEAWRADKPRGTGFWGREITPDNVVDLPRASGQHPGGQLPW